MHSETATSVISSGNLPTHHTAGLVEQGSPPVDIEEWPACCLAPTPLGHNPVLANQWESRWQA